MLPAFSSQGLYEKLRGLDVSGQRVFGALCCERMIPNYSAFKNQAKWGDDRPLLRALDAVWLCLVGHAMSVEEINALNQECEFMAPSSNDFDSLLVTSAQDACFAICGLLDHVVNPSLERIVKVAEYATDSIDLYVQEIDGIEPGDPNLENMILVHPLMQQELTKQERDLAAIKHIFSTGTEASGLIALRRADKVGSLGQYA